MRKFNVTAICVPEMHYMVDVSRKIAAIKEYIDEGAYFTINRGRQKGKTTLMNAIRTNVEIARQYLVIGISFEGVSDIFTEQEKFCATFFGLIANSFAFTNPELGRRIETYGLEVADFKQLNQAITRFCLDMERDLGKDVVLMIDEVDKASNFWVFMDFLGMLRAKYINRSAGLDKTFKSVILAGVNDVKRLKAHIKDRRVMTEAEAENLRHSEFNSPWNIAEDFTVDVDFDPAEIETMLDDYVSEHPEIEMIKPLVAATLHKHSSGYPFLVSKLCKIIAEDLDDDWSVDGIQQAINRLLDQKNTLFDDLIKNVENIPKLADVVSQLLLENEAFPYNNYSYEIGEMYSILKNNQGKVAVHNPIFETLLRNYLVAELHQKSFGKKISEYSMVPYGNPDGSLDMERALLKFQEYFQSVYANLEARFVEREGRLLLLAFFKPIINGTGFYFVEPHTGYEKRQDLVITFNGFKYVVELKVWRGEQYHQAGLHQLADYLELEKLDKGYLVSFNFNQNKEYTYTRLQCEGKDIFAIWV